MVKTSDALRIARSLIGTPYGSGPGQLDCINLIKKIIRDAPGGQKKYTDAGTAALWASYHSSGKYKHLIWVQEGIHNAEAGMLAFKGQPLGRDGQPHHVGIVTECGTVIHASSAMGAVVETELNSQWTLLAKHRYIETGVEEKEIPMDEEEKVVSTTAIVTAPSGSTVNLRAAPDTSATIVRRVPIGERVVIQTDAGTTWRFVTWKGSGGYMMTQFLAPDKDVEPELEPEPEPEEPTITTTSLMKSDGTTITLIGEWRVVDD